MVLIQNCLTSHHQQTQSHTLPSSVPPPLSSFPPPQQTSCTHHHRANFRAVTSPREGEAQSERERETPSLRGPAGRARNRMWGAASDAALRRHRPPPHPHPLTFHLILCPATTATKQSAVVLFVNRGPVLFCVWITSRLCVAVELIETRHHQGGATRPPGTGAAEKTTKGGGGG